MDLGNLTPDQLVELKAKLDGLTDVSGRSPMRPRQLHNLTLAPTAKDPRPLWVPSTEQPRDYNPGPAKYYPALMWHQETGEERTVYTREEQDGMGDSWGTAAPTAQPIDPLGDMQAALDALSPEDRKVVMEAQKRTRIADLQERLAGLSEAQLEALLSGAVAPSKRSKAKKAHVA